METTPPQFVNESQNEFVDIDSEDYRIYTFAKEGNMYVVRIDGPLKLGVSPSGGHRIFDASGVSHYIPPGWIELKWKAKPGKPNFVK